MIGGDASPAAGLPARQEQIRWYGSDLQARVTRAIDDYRSTWQIVNLELPHCSRARKDSRWCLPMSRRRPALTERVASQDARHDVRGCAACQPVGPAAVACDLELAGRLPTSAPGGGEMRQADTSYLRVSAI